VKTKKLKISESKFSCVEKLFENRMSFDDKN